MGSERKNNVAAWAICLVIWAGTASAQAQKGYVEALGKAILFFEGQRSGKLPSNQRVTWRGDSALSDGLLENVSLVGGYYDAGDNVKFVWPMAFSVALLGTAASEYGELLSAAGELGNLRTAIRWGSDFILRAHTSPTTFYTQVGDGNSDHQCWERPEDMDTPRTLYKITATSPGSEAAADAAAALASAAIVFRNSDAKYSAKLLSKSRTLFDFANNSRSSYQQSCPFYCSYSGFKDELLWAATWLYKATNESKFLAFLESNQDWSFPVNEFSWDNKYAGAQILLAKEQGIRRNGLGNYKTHADAFVCSLMPSSSTRQISTTPGGLLFTRDTANIQYAAGAAFLLSLHARTVSTSVVQCGSTTFSASQISSFAKSQVEYILGKNPQGISYMVGYGTKYPTQLHHRGASLPSIKTLPAKVTCQQGQSWFNAAGPNPNIHVGAVVGGPDSTDRFNDQRSDHAHLEPTTYINAAFIGAVAPFV